MSTFQKLIIAVVYCLNAPTPRPRAAVPAAPRLLHALPRHRVQRHPLSRRRLDLGRPRGWLLRAVDADAHARPLLSALRQRQANELKPGALVGGVVCLVAFSALFETARASPRPLANNCPGGRYVTTVEVVQHQNWIQNSP